MPEPQAHAANARVDGWTRYYEYFHKLSDHMRVSNGIPCLRRLLPGANWPACERARKRQFVRESAEHTT